MTRKWRDQIEQVHRDRRRIGKLDEKDPLSGNASDRLGVDAACQRVETVEDQPDGGVIGTPHHLPGVAVIEDVAAPGQRLEPDPQPARRGDLAQRVEIRRRPVDAAHRRGVDRGTDQHQVGAKFGHQVELAPGPGEGARAMRLGQALEIAERLEKRDLQPVVAHHRADLARGAVEGDEILLEDLDAVKAGGGDRRQLVAEITRDRYRRDRGFHRLPPPARRLAAQA